MEEVIEIKERTRDDLRNKILMSVRRMAVQEGWEAVSMRKIANEVNFSVPVIYDYFENRNTILIELREIAYQVLNELVSTAIANEKAPQKQIFKLGSAYWNFAFRYPEYYQLIYNLNGVCLETPGEDSVMHKFIHILKDAIAWLYPPAKYDEQVAGELVDELLSILHGTVSLAMAKQLCNKENDEAVLLKALERYVRGVVNF